MIFFDYLPRICSNKLPSEILYENFHSYLSSVKTIHQKCIRYASEYSNRENFGKLCSTVVKYLRDDVPTDKKFKFTCGRCKLFNYWVFDKLIEIFGKDDNKHILAFGKLQLVLSDINDDSRTSQENTCELIHDMALDQYWNIKKQFYEYCEDYHKIKIRSTIKDADCEAYRNYIEKNTLLDEYIKEIKSGNNLKNNSKFYEKDNKCDPKSLLSKLLESESKEFEEGSEEPHGGSFTAEMQTQDEKAAGDGDVSHLSNLPGNSEILGGNAATTAFPVLGIFLSALLFYRFTPMGTWVQKKVRGEKINWENHEEDMHELLAHTSESTNINSHSVPYHIAYEPA
ncbi:PIR Superfamily Protein [Plasmodium ovale wallikeri]|uniref:PIR Superfamily Protein n=1 Tax=Plasmodium ovale wallikeri TaxID=864142 RepID=A0A1A9AJ65_PLAOA|nr:PIR Superfamily Protein [Plasmodium ovale wallikeri]SBT56659.1 PIR Superfamily Protein [Plasmodium ovale wallikeri]